MSDDARFPRSMGPVDAMFWRLEEERTLRSPTLAVSILEAAPEREAMRATLRRACRGIPRLRQRVIELPAALANPVWSEDPDFSLDDHLRWTTIPADGGPQQLLDLAAAMAMQSFDRARPLWEYQVVEGLADGRAAVIQKLHHSVGDGAAGVALMREIYDFEQDAPRPEDEPPRDATPEPEESVLTLTAEALASDLAEAPRNLAQAFGEGLAALRSPLESARRATEELQAVAGIMRSGPGPLSPIMRERSSRCHFATLTVPAAGLSAAARTQDCTFNDAFLAAIAGGLAHYHERRGAPVDTLRGAIPISIRSADDAFVAGNRLAIGRFPVDVSERDPGQRMRALHALVTEQRQPASLGAFEAVAALVNRAPPALVLPLVLEEMRKSDFVATTVVGPPTPLYLAGKRVESFVTLGPTAGAALNATLFRYADQASVGLTMDAAAIPDPALLVECLQQGLDEVLKLA